jgi:hypothetical protein
MLVVQIIAVLLLGGCKSPGPGKIVINKQRTDSSTRQGRVCGHYNFYYHCGGEAKKITGDCGCSDSLDSLEEKCGNMMVDKCAGRPAGCDCADWHIEVSFGE